MPETTPPIRSLCVFCGSRNGTDPAYLADATAVGRMIAEIGWRLVYGAGDVGLMGAVGRAAMDAGATTMGVIPTHLLRREQGRMDLGQVVITEDMHERKKVMFMNSDAVAVLPGGAGSLDEFFEVLTWAQIGLHGKPIYLLNTNGYLTNLIKLLNHIIAQGFAEPSMLTLVTVMDNVPDLTRALRAQH